MMQVHIKPADLAGPWTFWDGIWNSGGSHIAPYKHPAVESFAIKSLNAILLIVRERKVGTSYTGSLSSESDAKVLLPKLLDWPLNIQIVEIDSAARQVRLHTGAQASVPLFLTCRNGWLHADWDIAHLYRCLPVEIDFAAAAFQLVYNGIPYSRKTLLAHVKQLTERAKMEWRADHNQLSIHYPRSLGRIRPRELHNGADVHEVFTELFGALIKRV